MSKYTDERATNADGYGIQVIDRPPVPFSRRAAIRAVTAGRPVVYAMRVPCGAIKIGTTVNLMNRLSALHGELLAFRFGSYDTERAFHAELKDHLVRGREFFHDCDAVQAVVERIRAGLAAQAEFSATSHVA